jgi:rod shape-determining protein MreB
MDEAVASYIRRRHNVMIGDRTAEQIKIAIGNAMPSADPEYVEAQGRDLVHGFPKSLVISETEVHEALNEPINQIVEVVRRALEKCPPELSGDIVERGITMVGGGALLKNLDKRIELSVGISARVAEDPLSAVVVGSGQVLDRLHELKEVVLR